MIKWVRWVVIGVTVAGMLSGCASTQAAGRGHDAGTSDPPPLAAALARWADFPVGATPRPLVLTGAAINDPASGFRTGKAKVAYVYGSFELATTLPTGPADVNGQPVITAAEAFADLRAQGDGSSVTSSLTVTDVSLGTAPFATDRGHRRLPAWIFTLAGVTDPASVLAVPPASRWPKFTPPSDTAQLDTFEIAPDGHRVTITFTGAAAGSGPCQAEYTADAAESSTAVAISIRQLPNSHASPDVACAAVGYKRTVTVALERDLGNRVLVNAEGVAIPEQ